jgi:hypothetical protein
MESEAKITPLRRRRPCRWCGSYDVLRHEPQSRWAYGRHAESRAKLGAYYVCANCGVKYMNGDELLSADGLNYLLHVNRWRTDALGGKLVTGPWGKPLEPGEPVPDRTVLTVKDVDHNVALFPHQHLEEIKAAAHRKRAIIPPTR